MMSPLVVMVGKMISDTGLFLDLDGPIEGFFAVLAYSSFGHSTSIASFSTLPGSSTAMASSSS